MKCPSLIVMICMYCGAEYERKDGRGVSGESHGICIGCVELRKKEVLDDTQEG